MKRKIYKKLLEWKENDARKVALLIDGARRVGKSWIAEGVQEKGEVCVDCRDVFRVKGHSVVVEFVVVDIVRFFGLREPQPRRRRDMRTISILLGKVPIQTRDRLRQMSVP